MTKKDTPKQRKVKQISMREHIKKRSMWAGSKTLQRCDAYVLNNDVDSYTNKSYKTFELTELKFPPALYKTIDEIVVNAIDHQVSNPKLVDEIKIELKEDGAISVYNTGPGIYIEETKTHDGRTMYTPQLIFSEYLSGSNLDDDEETKRIVGGQNGLGAKITAVFSKYFTVETCDMETKQHYTQTYRDGLQVIEPPIIRKAKSKEKPYTKITFLLNFAEFKTNIKSFYSTLYKLIETRAWQASAYTGIKVSFNGKKIPVKTFKDYCLMFTPDVYYVTMTNKTKEFPWEVCIGLTDGKSQQLSMVNGVFLNSGGSHIRHIQNHIVKNLKPNVERELKRAKVRFNKNILLNNLFIFMKGSIYNPQFLSQTKDAISNSIDRFKDYKISDSQWNAIWLFVRDAVMSSFLKKQLGNTRLRANRGKVDVPKYQEANYCRNSKKCHECGLIITEGDSASGTAKKGLLSKKSDPKFNFDYFGYFGIQGVPVNGLKDSTMLAKKKSSRIPKKGSTPIRKITKKSDKTSTSKSKKGEKTSTSPVVQRLEEKEDPFELIGQRVPSNKITENERIVSLMKVLGLDYHKTYDFTPKGEKEWTTLRYGYIAGLTDQDLDGFNIFGLLVTFFMTYWPNLVKRGFIRRIFTPLIRAFPKNKGKNKVKEFYTEKEAEQWVNEIGEAKVKSSYTFNYYKGLGSHDESIGEVSQMFKNIDKKICTYELDKDSVMNMFIYYGPDTSLRKIALRTDVTDEPVIGQRLPLSQQFTNDSKLYQRDNIIRKLINGIDGFVDCRRKVFFTVRKLGKTKRKVQGVAGSVVALANYHHGEASLEQSIVRMALAYPDGRNLPLLQPSGNFGTRSKGYKDSAASRYIKTVCNWRLADKLFRKEDEFILDYTLVDGERFEPDKYAPVIPYALCESDELPATGWTICTHARKISDLFKNARKMIKGQIKKCGKLSLNTDNFNGRFEKVKDKLYFVGDYVYDEDENKVVISGLPPNKWSYFYLEGAGADKISKRTTNAKKENGIKYKEWVDDYQDETTTEEVKIVLYLKDGAADIIKKNYGDSHFDAFEDYFELKAVIHDRINLVNGRNEVVEYKNYEDVFNDWFEYRKELYGIRVAREKILVDLEIQMLKEIQRFSRSHDDYKITSKTSDEKANSILTEHKYKIFNKTMLNNPKYTEVKELRPMITEEKYGANYDYLLSLSYRDLTKNAYQKRAEKIKALEKRQRYLEDDETSLFPGANIWLHELDECEEAIKQGKASGWLYGENGYTFEGDDDNTKSKQRTRRKK